MLVFCLSVCEPWTRFYGSKILCYSNSKALKQYSDKALEKLDLEKNITGCNRIKTCKIAPQYLLNYFKPPFMSLV